MVAWMQAKHQLPKSANIATGHCKGFEVSNLCLPDVQVFVSFTTTVLKTCTSSRHRCFVLCVFPTSSQN